MRVWTVGSLDAPSLSPTIDPVELGEGSLCCIPNNFPAEGDARPAPPLVKINILGMDPARFPADPARSAEVRISAVRAKSLMLAMRQRHQTLWAGTLIAMQ